MIERVVHRWHRFVDGGPPGDLDRLLAADVVLYSPILYTPQRGRAVTRAYLQAAAVAMSGDVEGRFRYTKQVVSEDIAVLEFETTIFGTHVNGVDIIRCDDAGQVVELRVMVRPLRAVHTIHQQMQATIAAMTGTTATPAADGRHAGAPSAGRGPSAGHPPERGGDVT